MRTVLVAADSFKGGLDQQSVCHALAEGIRRGCHSRVDLDLCPLADGGEGTGLVVSSWGGAVEWLIAEDAYGRPRRAQWIRYHRTALVEASQGSPYVPPGDRPFGARRTTSRGTGQLLRHALEDPGIEDVWLALGGSGSVDGGLGLLVELGARFFDRKGGVLEPSLEILDAIWRAEFPTLSKPVTVLADVMVPLSGPTGALRQFGPQKGLPLSQALTLDGQLGEFSERVAPGAGGMPGAGAAGGMGFALGALGARIVSGADWLAARSRLDERAARADLVVTGEGRLDPQSLMGKVISVVLKSARKAGKPVVVIAGQIPEDMRQYYDSGVSLALALPRGPMTLEESIHHTEALVRASGEQIGRMLDLCDALSNGGQ